MSDKKMKLIQGIGELKSRRIEYQTWLFHFDSCLRYEEDEIDENILITEVGQ